MLGFAVFTLTLLSCAKNDTFQNEMPSNAVVFSNLNDRVTSRSANDTNDDYGVYAYLNNGSPAASDWFMSNQQVNGADNSYSPLKYWPKDGNIDFYAYAPYNSGSLALDEIAWDAMNPAFQITYTVPASADEDFTIARPVLAATRNGGQVELGFSHMLAKFEFQIDLSDDLKNDNFAVTIESVKVNLAYDKGVNSLSTPGDWSSLSGTDVVYSGADNYMIMPQPSIDTGLTFYIDVTHNGEAYFNGAIKSYTIKAGDVSTPSAAADMFVQGTKYLFSVVINEITEDDGGDPVFHVIRFNPTVTPWVPSNVSVTP